MRLVSKFVFFALVILSLVMAEDTYWERSHYFGLRLNGSWSGGDIKKSNSIALKDSLSKEEFFLPSWQREWTAELELGANMNAHSIAFLYLPYAKLKNASYFRVGLAYTYYLLFPQALQFGLGFNLSYTKISLSKNVLTQELTDKDSKEIRSDGSLMGNAFSPILSMKYYFNPYLGAELALQYRYFLFSSLYTKTCGTCSLDRSLIQHLAEINIMLFFQI